jgi:chromate transport protein ChrA
MESTLVAALGLLVPGVTAIAAFLWLSRRNRDRLDLHAILLSALIADVAFHIAGPIFDRTYIPFYMITVVTVGLYAAVVGIVVNVVVALSRRLCRRARRPAA